LPPVDDNGPESMIQRVVRQIRKADLNAPVTVATSLSQHDSVVSQLGKDIRIVTEPTRRNTFPAICLACEYLAMECGCPDDEVIVIMPCDPFTEEGYFNAIRDMAAAASANIADLMVMGITPTYPRVNMDISSPARRTMMCSL
ncbi:MAG: mannose-1-phosphate guanylyltransferase, partial [Muribaculaceae bacterium]|nr:mannose-1-phosphate guanylyltransferase [Muribaculaceae bacterium]